MPGRAVDPGYVELSESTGGQLFLLQKGEAAHSAPIMSAPYTHPSTLARAVGHLAGTREIDLPVDSTVQSILVLASVQCRGSIAVIRPNGSEVTGSAATLNTDLQAGRIVQVDTPEAGMWKVRLTGTGLYVVSGLAKSSIKLNRDADDEQFTIAGNVANVRFQIVDAAGERTATIDASESAERKWSVQARSPFERYRIAVTGVDSSGRPFQRVHPPLLRAAGRGDQ